ncbi:MAG TPA: sulfite exporter TauE/SafE family protein [Candidatus Omnitrophica bacterium]|nr:sulfite exporter TauE/SafE family protein [Candidatus Omnitrophota bacterium]
MLQTIIEGLFLGISTGVYCMGTCMLFFMPYLLVEGKKDIRQNSINILFFLLGRFLSYIGFAVFVGFLAQKYKQNIPPEFSYFCLVILSLLILVYAATRNSPNARICQRLAPHLGRWRMPLVLGLLSGLNPCVPFLAAASRVLTLGTILSSVVLFFAFFIGTSVYMIPFIFVAFLNRVERVKDIGLIIAFLCGVWFLFVGISGLIH